MGPGSILALDPLSSSRKLLERMTKNYFMTAWFIGLFLISVWSVLLLASQISMDPDWRDSELVVQPGTLLLFILIIFIGKSIIDADYNAVASKELLFLMTTPVDPTDIARAKFARVVMYNLALLSLALGTMAGLHHLNLFTAEGNRRFLIHPDGIPWQFLLDLVIIVVMASAMGFVYSILAGLPLQKRAVGVIGSSGIIVMTGYILREMHQSWTGRTLSLLALTLVAIIVVLVASYWFEDSWVERTGGKKAHFFQKRGSNRWWDLALGGLDRSTAKLVRKELIINIQKREIAGNLIAIIGLAGLMLYSWQRIKAMEQVPEDLAALVYPVIIATGIFLSTTLQCALIGLGSVGKEGTKLWVLKSLPLPGLRVFKAKAVAILYISPITILSISIPLPMILGYNVIWITYFIGITVALLFTFTGIGLALGARYPNFDEAWGGTPDVITMYLTMILCMFVSLMMIGTTGVILSKNPVVGLLATGFFIALGFLFLCSGIMEGAKRYDELEPMAL